MKILYTILYPFWFFFSKTWVGNVMMIPITLSIVPLIIYLLFPDLMLIQGEEAEGVGIGIGIFAILTSPFLVSFFFHISDFLESKYVMYNYVIGMKYKMI